MTYISLIIPVFNNLDFLLKCLKSLKLCRYKYKQIIVVDDASTLDIKAHIDSSISYYRLEKQSGPAAARNYGTSKAKGEILMFLDSDVLVQPDTISKIAAIFKDDPAISAVFGSYDSEPSCTDLLSQFKNLYHHFVHQSADSDAKTFWAGCGAVRRQVFNDVGGFNEHRYKVPSVEDIDLGYRMRSKGYRILLDKDIQVKHLKSWTFKNWLNVEVFNRALPWSKLIIETDNFHSDLNLKLSDRISAVVVWFALLVIIASIVNLLVSRHTDLIHWYLLSLSILLIIILIMNFKFYKFLVVHRGVIFFLKAIPFHLLYYLYSSLVFGLIWIKYKISK